MLIDGKGPEVILMIHGWPDTATLWDAQAAHFHDRYRCVRVTLPGYDLAQPRRGYSLAEVVEHLARVADDVSPGRPVTLMTHDWGAFFGWQFARLHPHRVARIVAVDVGDAHTAEYRRGLSWKGVAMIAFYQLWLALSWRLGSGLGSAVAGLADHMTRWMARQIGCRSAPETIGAQMNYPYDITWTGSFGGYRGLPPLEPHCPVFYAWAVKKPVHFHSAAWLSRIAAVPRNRVMAFECGHWVMRSRAGEFNAAVRAWLEGL